MTHPWREHIKLTKENNPTIKNFGEIIKLAKQTYTKISNKKTQKKGRNSKGKKTQKKNGENNLELIDTQLIDCNSGAHSETQDVDKKKQEGGGVINADRIDKHGVSRRYRAIEEGECKFPFKYNNKTYNETDGCADSKDGKWCATSVDKKLKPVKWAYCETHLKSQGEDEEQLPKISSSEEEEGEEGEFVAHLITYEDVQYLLDKNTRNVYSMPDEEENYFFVGKALPNGTIDFEAIEYNPKKKNIDEEKTNKHKKIESDSDSSSSKDSKSSTGGGKYGINNEKIEILEKYGDIYRIKDSKGEIFLTDKNNIL
tara:strand:- start:77 stop:1015 length:939 start_codon:yes stop_codon:yes gene_type:complete